MSHSICVPLYIILRFVYVQGVLGFAASIFVSVCAMLSKKPCLYMYRCICDVRIGKDRREGGNHASKRKYHHSLAPAKAGRRKYHHTNLLSLDIGIIKHISTMLLADLEHEYDVSMMSTRYRRGA